MAGVKKIVHTVIEHATLRQADTTEHNISQIL